MKLVVTIPTYNEEQHIGEVITEIPRSIPGIREVRILVMDDGSTDQTLTRAKNAGADLIFQQTQNVGLAKNFSDAVQHALAEGADIIVNTDGDNHYNQARIPELLRPILQKEADIVIGSRNIRKLEGKMPWVNRVGNRIGSFVTTKIAGLPPLDVSSGFRAYSREAALKLVVYSGHTYTHATLIAAADQKCIITEVSITARTVDRPSRLIQSIPRHIFRAGVVILRNILLFKPLRSFSLVGGALAIIGVLGVGRFLFFYFTGSGQGHVQSLILSGVLIMVGFQIGVMGLLASAIGWNRKILEDVLYRIKKGEYRQR